MFPICDKKNFENFLILSMIVSFALTLLSRGSSSWPDLINNQSKLKDYDSSVFIFTKL